MFIFTIFPREDIYICMDLIANVTEMLFMIDLNYLIKNCWRRSSIAEFLVIKTTTKMHL